MTTYCELFCLKLGVAHLILVSLGHKGNINSMVLVVFCFFWSLLFRKPNSFQYPIDSAGHLILIFKMDKKRHIIAIHSFSLSPRFYAYVVDVLLCRMPPLQIAALKKRIQRPSYVPVDEDGNRLSDLTQHRTKAGAVSKSSGLCFPGRSTETSDYSRISKTLDWQLHCFSPLPFSCR